MLLSPTARASPPAASLPVSPTGRASVVLQTPQAEFKAVPWAHELLLADGSFWGFPIHDGMAPHRQGLLKSWGLRNQSIHRCQATQHICKSILAAGRNHAICLSALSVISLPVHIVICHSKKCHRPCISSCSPKNLPETIVHTYQAKHCGHSTTCAIFGLP